MNAMRRMFWVAAPALIALGCAGESGPSGILGGSAVTFRQVQDTIFTPTCATSSCHSGVGAPHDLDLRSGQAWSNIVNVASAEVPRFDRVSPGNALDSYLYMKVAGDPRIEGDRMPAFAPPLTNDKLLALQNWIDQGANP